MALELIKQMAADETPICACCWNQNIPGSLVTGDLDGNVRVWNLNSESKNDCQTLMTTKPVVGQSTYKSILSVAIHPDGDIVAVSSSNGSVRVSRISDKKHFTIFRKPIKEAVHQLQFSPEGTHLAGVGGTSASVKLWINSDNVWNEQKCINHQELHVPINEDPPQIYNGINNNFIASVAWNPSGTQVACGSMGGSICVFNVRENQVVHVFNCTTMSVISLAYSPLNDNILVSGSHDNCIRVHYLDEKKEVCVMSGHSGWVLSVDVSPDGKTIASGSSDKTVKLWDIETREPITTRADHSGFVCGVKFTGIEDGDIRLATVSQDATISLYKYCCCG